MPAVAMEVPVEDTGVVMEVPVVDTGVVMVAPGVDTVDTVERGRLRLSLMLMPMPSSMALLFPTLMLSMPTMA